MSDVPPHQVPMPGPMSNRSDQAPGQPVRVPTGLPYGEHKQLEQAQATVALPALNTTGAPPSPAALGGGVGGTSPAPAQGPIQADSSSLLDLLGHPTERPNEPGVRPAGAGPNTVSTQQVIQSLEQLIAQSDKVPTNVMRLYQNIRREANTTPFD